MPRPVALLISLLLHPLLLPTYAAFLLYATNVHLFAGYDSTAVVRMFLLLFINTVLFPAVAVLLLWRLGFLSRLQMPDSRERLLPYITSGIFYLWGFVVFRKSDLPPMLSIILLGATLTLFCTFLFNLFRKVSIHAGGAGAFLVLAVLASMLAPQPIPQLPMSAALAGGLVGTARLSLGAHSLPEVLTGYLIGLLCQAVAFYFY